VTAGTVALFSKPWARISPRDFAKTAAPA